MNTSKYKHHVLIVKNIKFNNTIQFIQLYIYLLRK